MNRPSTHLLLLLLACFASYWNTLHNGFHLDDLPRVLQNPGIVGFWPPWRHFFDATTCSSAPHLVQYRPLLPLSLSINYAISGHSVVGYHVGNILLQFGASAALYTLLRELVGRGNRVPLLVSLLFAVHPLSGVPVNYICGRDLSMMLGFSMLTLFAYARMRRLGATPRRWTFVLGLFLLAMLAKKNAIALPLVVLAYELLLRGTKPVDALKPFGLFVGGVALLLGFIQFGLGFSDFNQVVTHNWSDYAAAQLQHHTFHYLANFVYPFPIRMLGAEAPSLWMRAVGALALVGALGAAWHWRRTRPLRSFCILSYFAMIALTTSVLPMHSEVVSYRAYPGSPFLYLLVGLLVLGTKHGTTVMWLLIAFYAGCTMAMNNTWRDTKTLMRHSIEYGGNTIAYAKLAELSPPEAAEKLFEKAIELEPNFIGAHIGLARVHVQLGHKEQGLQRLETWVNKASDNPQVLAMAARILAIADEYGHAVGLAGAVIELAPKHAVYREQMSTIAFEAGRFDLVIEWLTPLAGQNAEVDRLLDESRRRMRK